MTKKTNSKFLTSTLIALAIGATGMTVATFSNANELANEYESIVKKTIDEDNDRALSGGVKQNNNLEQVYGTTEINYASTWGTHTSYSTLKLPDDTVLYTSFNNNIANDGRVIKFYDPIGKYGFAGAELYSYDGNELGYVDRPDISGSDDTLFKPFDALLMDDGTIIIGGGFMGYKYFIPPETYDPSVPSTTYIDWTLTDPFTGWSIGNSIVPIDNGSGVMTSGSDVKAMAQLNETQVAFFGNGGQWGVIEKNDTNTGFDYVASGAKTYNPNNQHNAFAYDTNKVAVTGAANQIYWLEWNEVSNTWIITSTSVTDWKKSWNYNTFAEGVYDETGELESIIFIPNSNDIIIADPITKQSHSKEMPTTRLSASERANVSSVTQIDSNTLLVMDLWGGYFFTDRQGNVIGYDDPMNEMLNPYTIDLIPTGTSFAPSQFPFIEPQLIESGANKKSLFVATARTYSTFELTYSTANDIIDLDQTKFNMIEDPSTNLLLGVTTYEEIEESIKRNIVSAFYDFDFDLGSDYVDDIQIDFYLDENCTNIINPVEESIEVWNNSFIAFKLHSSSSPIETSVVPDVKSRPLVMDFEVQAVLESLEIVEVSSTSAMIQYDFKVPSNIANESSSTSNLEVNLMKVVDEKDTEDNGETNDEIIKTKVNSKSKDYISIDGLEPNTSYSDDEYYLTLTYPNEALGAGVITTTTYDNLPNDVPGFTTLIDEVVVRGEKMAIETYGGPWYQVESNNTLIVNPGTIGVYNDSAETFNKDEAVFTIKVIDGFEITEYQFSDWTTITLNDDPNTLAKEYRVVLKIYATEEIIRDYEFANIKLYPDGDVSGEGIDIALVDENGLPLIQSRIPEDLQNSNRKLFIIIIILIAFVIIIQAILIIFVVVRKHHFHH